MFNFKLSRRQWFLVTFIGLALVAILSTYSWLATNKPISIASHTWLGYEPMFMARNEGWLDGEQVHLFETKSATESLQALAEGKVDGAALTLDEALRARATGLPLTVVMIFNTSAGADILVVRPSIKELSQLKGKRIGVEKSSVGELMQAEILRLAGLTIQDVEMVAMPIDRHLDAWKRQQVDATITYEPVASQIIAQGGIKLFDTRSMPNTIVDVLVMRTDRLDVKYASAIRHLIATHFKALRHFNHNSQDAAYRMASHLGLPAMDVLSAYKGLLLPDAANNYRLLAGSSPKLKETAKQVSSVMFKAGMLKQEDALDHLIDATYLPADALQ